MKSLFSSTVLLLLLAAPANATLLVAPTRVIFEKNQRETEVLLVNKGQAPETYRISFINNRQLPSGGYERITTPTSPTGENFAHNFTRFSPRQIRVNPGQTQTVRLSLRKPAGLAPGEYRSHLLFEKIPETQAAQQVKADPAKKLQIAVTMVPGVSIPVIVRHGQTAAEATINKPGIQFAPGKKSGKLFVPIQRKGNQSIYGNLRLLYQGAKDLDATQVGVLNQISILTPGTHRQVTIPFELPANVSQAGTFRIEFTSAEPNSDGRMLATYDLAIN